MKNRLKKIKLFKFNRNTDSRGSLTSIEGINDIPIEIKRVFYLTNITKDREVMLILILTKLLYQLMVNLILQYLMDLIITKEKCQILMRVFMSQENCLLI